MARINIEDDFWVDIGDVTAKVGDFDKAIGMVVRFFKYAQRKHKEANGITRKQFEAEGFTDALFPKFAEETENGIIVRGAEKHFGWLRKKAEAGKIGGKSPKKRQKKAKGSKSKHTQADESKVKQTEPSSSYSLSSSDSVVVEEAPAPPETNSNNTNHLQNFEDRFDEGFQKFNSFLEENDLDSPKMKRRATEVWRSFGSIEKFTAWLDQLRASSAYKKIKFQPEKQRYVLTAILKETNLIPEQSQ